jgi:hypothetical protein
MSGIRLLVLVMAGGLVVLNQAARGATIQEDFSTNPATQGWRVFGNTNQFGWDATHQNLQVTWDSSKSNSYFYHPLGTILTRNDDFSLSFDLQLQKILPGANTNKSGAFELAIGLLNLNEATRTNFLRGTGSGSPNLVELDYFPDAGFGPTIWPTFISTNSAFNYNGPGDFAALALTTGDLFHVVMNYTASNTTLVTIMTRNGAAFGPINPVALNTNFTDFRVDAFAISSYSDEGDDFDSLLANGTIDNLVITTPPPPVAEVTGGFVSANTWQVQFASRSNWLYTLERSTDLQGWTAASGSVRGNATNLVLQDTAATPGSRLYRVRAQLP